MNLISRTIGHGPHLVLLHGWGLNSGVWQALIQKLQSSFSITTIDLPGFGLNCENYPATYNLPEISKKVANVLPENAILVGWSLGGLLAQQISIMAPEKVNHLVLVATSPKFIESENWPGIKKSVLVNFKEQLAANVSNTISRFLAIQAMGSRTAKKDIKEIKYQVDAYPQANPKALEAGLEILAHSDLRNELVHISCPIDVFLGRLDSLVPVKVIDELAKLNSRLKVTLFEHSSHAPFISEAERFADLLLHIGQKAKIA